MYLVAYWFSNLESDAMFFGVEISFISMLCEHRKSYVSHLFYTICDIYLNETSCDSRENGTLEQLNLLLKMSKVLISSFCSQKIFLRLVLPWINLEWLICLQLRFQWRWIQILDLLCRHLLELQILLVRMAYIAQHNLFRIKASDKVWVMAIIHLPVAFFAIYPPKITS